MTTQKAISIKLLTTAFVNEEGIIVIVAMNVSDDAMSYTVTLGSKTATLEMPARAIQTLLLK